MYHEVKAEVGGGKGITVDATSIAEVRHIECYDKGSGHTELELVAFVHLGTVDILQTL